MTQLTSPAVLYINKLSVLLVCIMLLLLWLNVEFTKSNQQTSIDKDVDENNHHSSDSIYIKTLSLNPFLRSHEGTVSKDMLPTVTALQSTIPTFSSLELRLHGIVYQHAHDSYAMISMHGAIQEIFSVNGEISEGLYLTNIAKEQVEVNYFGEHHVLVIENNRLSNESDEQKTKLGFNKQIEFLEVDKQRNPIRLFMIRRPYAVYSNGEFQGYKIMPGSNADQFKRLGFQSGDIITYLNGVEFTGPGKKEFVIQQLTHAMHIDLTVMRGNQELNINYGF